MTLDLLDPPPADTKHSPATTSAAASPVGSPSPSDARQTAAIRVLHIINGDHYAGAERVQDLLAMRLREFGFEVAFAVLKGDAFAAARADQQAAIYDARVRGRFDLRTVRKIADIVRRDGFSIVHAHTARSALLGRCAAAMAGVPMVYHVHSPTIRNTTRLAANLVNTLAERISLIGSPRLITVSNSLAAHMRHFAIPARRMTVVHNGVPGPVELAPRRAPAGEWTLGVVALFRPRKGVEVLLDAIGLLQSYGCRVRLRAVGRFETPQYEAEIMARVARLGIADAIDWVGFTRDIPAQLLQMDLFVLPSLFGEGLPMVVLEAMAHGVPMVATDVEGVPEAVRDGLDGLIAQPGDAADLARTIRRYLDNQVDWQAIRTSALARHQESFSDRAMAAKVAAVYREVLGLSGAAGSAATH
jgi:glycosyltransferase involved in cell wall biosynthesis